MKAKKISNVISAVILAAIVILLLVGISMKAGAQTRLVPEPGMIELPDTIQAGELQWVAGDGIRLSDHGRMIRVHLDQEREPLIQLMKKIDDQQEVLDKLYEDLGRAIYEWLQVKQEAIIEGFRWEGNLNDQVRPPEEIEEMFRRLIEE